MRQINKDLDLRSINDSIETYIEEYNTELGKIQVTEYKSPSNLPNHVLSRNCYESNLLREIALNTECKGISTLTILKKIFRYYLKSLSHFILYITFFFYIKFFDSLKTKTHKNIEELIVIDNYFLADDILGNGSYREKYFSGLIEVLKQKDIPFTILPRFYGVSRKNILRLKQLKKILNKTPFIVLEFHLLTVRDLFYYLVFLLFYPVKNLKLSLKYKDSLEKKLQQSLFETVDQPPSSYLRYLLGRRYNKLGSNNVKVISWFENQALDKCYYSGIRNSAVKNKIYGCQPYIFSNVHTHLTPTVYEEQAKVLPDIILRNGKYYLESVLNKGFSTEFRLCPSFRYKTVFENIEWDKLKSIGLLLSYFEKSNMDLLDTVTSSSLQPLKLKVKFHPAYRDYQVNKVKKQFPEQWSIFTGDVYEILNSCWLIITTESGTALEAVARGVSVIVVANRTTFTANPLVERGKGEVWEMVYDDVELNFAVEKLKTFRERSMKDCRAHAEFYQKSFFTPVNEETICSAFDL
ncbi:MAG: hypothetical protein NE327_04685 [Lentisphaeraceae bacterium]|nr:hypothetical protein [Lentisphaeraceae bacterium]